MDTVPALDEELQRVIDFHGFRCPGTLLLTQLARAAMAHLGLARHDRNLFAYVESGRCHTSGVQVVTGCTLGSRRLVVKDYGKAAVTLVDRLTRRAVRASCRPGFPTREMLEGRSNEEKFLAVLAHDPAEYVVLREVELREELPQVGPPTRSDYCGRCGERVLDGRLVEADGASICFGCAEPYYEVK